MAGAECPELGRSAVMSGQRPEPEQGPVLGRPDRAR